MHRMTDESGPVDVDASDDSAFNLDSTFLLVLDDYDEKEFDLVDGYQCETLESILEFKKRLRRPKDLKDIVKIKKALKIIPE